MNNRFCQINDVGGQVGNEMAPKNKKSEDILYNPLT